MEQKLYLCKAQNTTVMNLEARKYQFIQKLSDVNEALFEQLENLLKKGTENTNRISIEQYNKELDEANARIDNGEFYTQEEVEKMAKEW